MDKEIRISMRIDGQLKEEFFALCESRQQTASKVIKHLMREWIARNTPEVTSTRDYPEQQ